MPLSVELVIIGDELLSGRTKDANGPVLAKFCQRLGAQLRRVHIIGDELQEISQTLLQASQNSQLVICSGGLGPTPDDRTKNALAQMLESPLEESQAARDLLAIHYGRIKREWTAKTNHYHLLPRGVSPVHNFRGLAPGLKTQHNGSMFLFLPGVPLEFEAMLEEHFSEIALAIAPELRPKASLSIRTHGVPEEKIFGELCPGLWDELEALGKLSSLPHYSGVDLILSATKMMSDKEQRDWEKNVKELIERKAVKDHIWQWGDLSLPSFLLQKCREKKWTLGFAESCTGGLASSMITDISGSSDQFMGSIICYSNDIKKNQLGVKDETLSKYGAVSLECAEELAEGLREKLKVDLAVSFSGVAGPLGGSVEKPVGTVSIAVATPARTVSALYHFHGNRELLKRRFAAKGMHMALSELLS